MNQAKIKDRFEVKPSPHVVHNRGIVLVLDCALKHRPVALARDVVLRDIGGASRPFHVAEAKYHDPGLSLFFDGLQAEDVASAIEVEFEVSDTLVDGNVAIKYLR